MIASEIVVSPPGGENSYQVVQSDGFFRDGRIRKAAYRNANGPPNGAQHRLHRADEGRSRLTRRYVGRVLLIQAQSRGGIRGVCSEKPAVAQQSAIVRKRTPRTRRNRR